MFIKGTEFISTLYPDYKTKIIKFEPTINLPQSINNITYQMQVSCPLYVNIEIVQGSKLEQLSYLIDIELLPIEHQSEPIHHAPYLSSIKMKSKISFDSTSNVGKGLYCNTFMGYIDNKNWAITMSNVRTNTTLSDKYSFTLKLLRLSSNWNVAVILMILIFVRHSR